MAFARIDSTGITSLAFKATSDRRLKKDFSGLETQINNIKSLSPVRFKWIENNREDIGFIAQEVFKLYPTMQPPNIDGNIDELCDASGNPTYLSMDYGKLTTCLWKGLQETIEIVETQKDKIQQMETTIQAQQLEIDTLKHQMKLLFEKLNV